MSDTQQQIQYFLTELPTHFDNPEWLSNCAMKLATLLYNHNTEMAEAEHQEAKILVELLESSVGGDTKKMSVAEAEKRATATTGNAYKRYKAQGEAIVEVINSIKRRLEILSWEHRG